MWGGWGPDGDKPTGVVAMTVGDDFAAAIVQVRVSGTAPAPSPT